MKPAPAARRRRAMRSERGSVSVYLIVVSASVLLFVSVLIDYARIAAFEKQAEIAANAGVRSVLSAYDETLLTRYGLFGRGGTDGGEIFGRVVAGNLRAERYFQLLDADLQDAHVNAYESLGHHTVLKRQILEDMKYKGPVDFALEMAGKFQPLEASMREAADTAATLEELRNLYDERQDKLQAALAEQRKAAQAVGSSGLARLVPASAQGAGSGTASAVADGYGKYREKVRELPSLPPEMQAIHAASIAAYARSARTTADELLAAGDRAGREHDRHMRLARQELEAAERLNERMSAIAAAAGEQAGGGPAEADGASPAAELAAIRAEGGKLVMKPAWFAEYRRELDRQSADLAAIDAQIGSFRSAVSSALSSRTSADGAALREGAAGLRDAYLHYDELYLTPGETLAAREQAIRLEEEVDGQLRDMDEQTSAKWGEARQMLQRLGALTPSEEVEASYARLRTLYERSLSWNEAVGEAGPSAAAGEADKADAPEEAPGALDGNWQSGREMDKAGGMFEGVGSMLTGVRDELYLNEYAVHRFTASNPQRLGAVWKGGSSDGDNAADGLALNEQETEFIVYGKFDAAQNLALAYGEIFAVRVAVRTMEGLIECRSLGHPLLILAGAALYGLEKALEDMSALFGQGTTPISKYVPGEMAYRDYLRLFLLVHGKEAEKLARIAALIEYNTGYRLHEIPSGITAEATVSVNLWFLPGAMRALDAGGLLRGKVRGGRYETTRTTAWSY